MCYEWEEPLYTRLPQPVIVHPKDMELACSEAEQSAATSQNVSFDYRDELLLSCRQAAQAALKTLAVNSICNRILHSGLPSFGLSLSFPYQRLKSAEVNFRRLKASLLCSSNHRWHLSVASDGLSQTHLLLGPWNKKPMATSRAWIHFKPPH